MKFVKQIVVLAILGAVAVGGYYGWQTYGVEADAGKPKGGGKDRAVTVEMEAAAFRSIDVVAEAVGSTRALRTVEITPLATGRVTQVGFKAGDLVKAGDVLLKLDDDIQRADLAEAEARLSDAETALKRSETLKRQNAVATATVESAQTQVSIAKAERDRAVRNLRERVIRAPFAGVVGYSHVELGARVEDGDMVTVLDDLSVVEVEFSLPENLYGKVGVGAPVVADAAAFPDRQFKGTIETFDSRVDPVSRSFKARAKIANDDRALPAGMFVHLSVILNAEQALSIPEEAVVIDGSRAFVFAVVEDGEKLRAERRFIEVGRRSFGFVEVKDGIAEGEKVVTRGVQKVRDGMTVQLKKPPAPKPEPAPAGAGT